jgi:16S rRNA (cytosine967-C5)-methyltransferase
MRDGGRLAAAISVLEDMDSRHKPVRLALKSWGEGARYAGSRDRAFVAGLVLDCLRRRRSLAWRMADETWRSISLAAVKFAWGWPDARIAAAAADGYGPGALSEAEIEKLVSPNPIETAPTAVRGDYPDWVDPMMARAFGDKADQEGVALAERAPVDIRVNTLKTDIERGFKALKSLGAKRIETSSTALRISPPEAAERTPPLEALPEFAKGWFEIQDLGSQIAAKAAIDIAGRQVLDFCAGGGGKTLALAAQMGNTGQLFAYDADGRRLADTQARARRAGVRNLQVRTPLRPDPLQGLESRMDLVFVDAPCTGSGVWRRHPDAKWRLSEEQLRQRMIEQDEVLTAASGYVKMGGRLIYVTCSLFCEENEDRVEAFLARSTDFHLAERYRRFTPRTNATDGFFIAELHRQAATVT